MKKFLVAATFVVAGLAVGLQAEEGREKGKGKGKGGDPAKRAEAMIKNLDKDGNGTLSKEEFAASPFAAKAKEKAGEDAIDKIFARRDTNKDGQLDQAELAAPPQGGKGRPEGRPEGKGRDKDKPEGKPEGKGRDKDKPEGKPEGKDRDKDKPEGKPEGKPDRKSEGKPEGGSKPEAE